MNVFAAHPLENENNSAMLFCYGNKDKKIFGFSANRMDVQRR